MTGNPQMDLNLNKFLAATEKGRLLGDAAGTPHDRARTSVTNGLRQELKKIMAEHKDIVGRRYFTKIISNNGGEDFLQKAAQEHGKGDVLETVVEIKNRLEAAKEIEKNMAVMVEAQADQIEHQRSSRKCMCIGLALVLIRILLTVIPIATSFKSF
ncbi:hypothetical protein MKW92_009187 [Papaver armeniacum]|nr:hypothetical protein MKW92_009187 [Papaver armeniacum]